MNDHLQQQLSRLEGLILIQKDSLAHGYMHGMLNGLIVAHSVITGDNPDYVVLPKSKNYSKIRHKSAKKK